MKKNINIILLIGFFFTMNGCIKEGFVNQNELIKYISKVDNGLIAQKNSLTASYRISYRPIDLIIKQEIKNKPYYNLDSLKNELQDRIYFILNMSIDSMDVFGSNKSSFNDLLKKISFGMEKLIYLKDNNTNLEYYLEDFVYPRLYGNTGTTSVLLCFKKAPTDHNFSIYLKDFLNNSEEPLRFDFQYSDIKKTPKLNFEIHENK